jgi:glycosyltransferase involved in cell wall biosynthesis
MPKVSAIVPNYNHARFLEQRIRSILEQTYQDFELIYLDDASTDNSNEVFAKFANHPKVRSIFNTTNSGSPFKQWNKGVRLAQGEYIWIAESDDYAEPHFLETLVAVLDQNPKTGLVYCQSCLVDEDSKILSHTYEAWTNDISTHRWSKNFINSGTSECKDFLVCKNTIPNASAVLFRKNLYTEFGGADETFVVAGDWLAWTKILLASDVNFIAEPLNYFRCHPTSTSRNSMRLGSVIREALRIISLIRSRVGISTEAETKSFQVITSWWSDSLWKSHLSRKEQIEIYLEIMNVFSRPYFRLLLQQKLISFFILKFRSHLKIGTKLNTVWNYLK